jgi:guanosine-3',5'-bis(diphosphate) 3'-pyrophosphohydrolase
VALMLCETGDESNVDLLIAAVLHDTIEDTQTSPEEIEQVFGKKILDIVLEVTDDKNLPKEERKRMQVLHAATKSELARKLKLADKICNVRDIIHHPPVDWPLQRKLAYLTWAEEVLTGLRDSNSRLEEYLRNLITEGRTVFAGQ